jgi:hypothetical protein
MGLVVDCFHKVKYLKIKHSWFQVCTLKPWPYTEKNTVVLTCILLIINEIEQFSSTCGYLYIFFRKISSLLQIFKQVVSLLFSCNISFCVCVPCLCVFVYIIIFCSTGGSKSWPTIASILPFETFPSPFYDSLLLLSLFYFFQIQSSTFLGQPQAVLLLDLPTSQVAGIAGVNVITSILYIFLKLTPYHM